MRHPPIFQKFSPLSEEKITQIVGDIEPQFIAPIAEKVEAAKEKNTDLITRYKTAEDKKYFLEKNLGEIAMFLKDCRLMGAKTEEIDEEYGHSYLARAEMIIGAEGLAIISAYLKNKDRNAGAHPVQIVKNIDLYSSTNSRAPSLITLENEHVHSGLYDQLSRDLQEAGGGELKKTYLVEAYGTTGMNHFVALTISKKIGEETPEIYLFDASPSLVRNGLEATQNSIANGYSSHIAINATLKKVFGPTFTEKYYNNSEPLMQAGMELCAFFAVEEAHRVAREGFDSTPYKYPSPFGGKTEMEFESLTLGLPAKQISSSQFTDTALKPRLEELKEVEHVKKDRSKESGFDRVVRYQTPEGHNSLAEQKALRQKFGHLFEIVISEAFEEKCRTVARRELPDYESSSYFAHEDVVKNMPEETHSVIRKLNKILPWSNKVNHAEFSDGECKMEILLGKIESEKLAKVIEKNTPFATVNIEEIDFSDQLVNVRPELAKVQRCRVSIPQEKFTAFVEKLGEETLYKKKEGHAFAPQKQTNPIEAAQVSSPKSNQII